MRARAGIVAIMTVALAAGPALAGQEDMQMVYEMALQKIEQGNNEDALRDLQRVLAADASFWPAYFHQGRLLGMMGDAQGARDSFIQAVELNPGNAEVHFMAAFASYQLGDFDVAWEQLIAAKQAGLDAQRVEQGLGMLRSVSSEPEDLEARLEVATVFVEPADETKLMAKLNNPFAQGVSSRTDAADISQGSAGGGGGDQITSRTSSAQATNQGTRIMQQSAGEINNLVLQTRLMFSESPSFGLVQNPEMARYRVVIEIDDLTDVGDTMAPMAMEGYLKLVDAQTGDEVHRHVLDFKDLSNSGDLRADLERVVGNLEQWMAEQGR